MEDTNENQKSRKLSGIYKFLQKIYPEFQSYSKTIEQVERQEEMGMVRRTLTGIQRIKRKNNKSTYTFSSEKER